MWLKGVTCGCTGRMAQPASGHHALFALCFIYLCGTPWLRPLPLLAGPPEHLSSAGARGTDRSAAGKLGEADKEQKVCPISRRPGAQILDYLHWPPYLLAPFYGFLFAGGPQCSK